MYKIVKKIFDFITLIILTVSLIGAFGIITAPSLRQADDIKQLEKELAANEKKLEKQKKTQKNNIAVKNKDSIKNDDDTKKESDEKIDIHKGITFIGDSVMLGASTTMEDKIDNCVINAKHSINANGKIGYTEFIIKGLGL